MKKRPSKGLTFLFSCCTGVGHLYLGAMTRGLQFLLIFFGSIAAIDIFYLNIFPFWIPVIWFYGMFDALQLADQETIEDKPLVDWRQLTGARMGYGLIGLGLFLIVDDVLPRVWNTFFSQFLTGWVSFRSLLMAGLLTGFGIVLLRGKRVK